MLLVKEAVQFDTAQSSLIYKISKEATGVCRQKQITKIKIKSKVDWYQLFLNVLFFLKRAPAKTKVVTRTFRPKCYYLCILQNQPLLPRDHIITLSLNPDEWLLWHVTLLSNHSHELQVAQTHVVMCLYLAGGQNICTEEWSKMSSGNAATRLGRRFLGVKRSQPPKSTVNSKERNKWIFNFP